MADSTAPGFVGAYEPVEQGPPCAMCGSDNAEYLEPLKAWLCPACEGHVDEMANDDATERYYEDQATIRGLI